MAEDPTVPNFLYSTMPIPLAGTSPKIDGKADDAIWASIPGQRFLDVGIGFDWGRNWAAMESAIVRMAYDRDNLYVICRVLESSADGIVPDNPEIWKTNCLEVFLQPKGFGTPYIQVAANPYGKNWSARWVSKGGSMHDRDQEPLALPRLRQACVVDGDAWTLELAIPFKDLGADVPLPHSAWRGHIGYTAKKSNQNLNWAYVWPLFGNQQRYGKLAFGDERPPVAGTHSLRGRLVDATGKPVVWGHGVLAAFDCNGRPVQTDSQGGFLVEGLAKGTVQLRSLIPDYDSIIVSVYIQQPREVIAPIVMRKSGNYRSGFQGTVGSGAAAFLKSGVELPPELPARPDAMAALDELAFLATPGEFESRAVCLFANRDIAAPEVVVDSTLRGANGELKLERLEVRWTQRSLVLRDNSECSTPENSRTIWRFLRSESPERLAAGDLRQVVVTLKVPEKAAPGEYTGRLRLRSGADEIRSVPVKLKVPNFTLVTPRKQVGIYHYQRVKNHPTAPILSDEMLRRHYRDMREHGVSQLVLIDVYLHPDAKDPYAELRHAIKLQQEAGFGPTYILSTWPVAGMLTSAKEADRRRFAELIQGLDAVEDELGLKRGQIVISNGDEVQRFPNAVQGWIAWSKDFQKISQRANYITVDGGPRGRKSLLQMVPYIGISCYGGSPLAWDELKAEPSLAKPIIWNYPNTLDDVLYARLANGYRLWNRPSVCAAPWTYFLAQNTPADGDVASDITLWCYAIPHPSKPEMVPTSQWEAFREGYDDLRYLSTLEQAIEKAPKESPACQKAVALLHSFLEMAKTPDGTAKVTLDECVERRARIAEAIEAMNGSFPWPKEKP